MNNLSARPWPASFAALKNFFSSSRALWLHGLLIVALTVARQPKAIFSAQFWAEDGTYWYQNAYESGWACLFKPYGGYLQLICRLTSLLAVHFHLLWGPLLFASVALIIQVLPPIFFLSSRFDAVVPSRAARLALAYFYVAIPNSWEIHVNLTAAQTHLALLGFLIVVAQRPTRAAEWAFDLIFLTLAGLSGPFVVFLAPIAWLHGWQEKNRAAWYRAVLISVLAVIQIMNLVLIPRPVLPLGADALLLSRLISNQVVLGAELGEHFTRQLMATPFWSLPWPPLVLAILAGLIVVTALVNGPQRYRLFVLFAAMQLAAALSSPLIWLTGPQWPPMALPGCGGRYFFLPMLAWFASLVVLVSMRSRVARTCAVVLMAISLVGISGDWFQQISRQPGFKQLAKTFDRAETGTKMFFPLCPDGWTMTLIKH